MKENRKKIQSFIYIYFSFIEAFPVPTISMSPTNGQVKSGETLNFTCSTVKKNSNITIQYRLLQDGKEVNADQQNDNIFMFKHITTKLSGDFTCQGISSSIIKTSSNKQTVSGEF